MSDVAAGPVAEWITELREAIAGRGSVNVPCGSCTACCTSSQFIEIGPNEHRTLRRIPSGLLFPAPRRPKGHVVMGFNKQGHCPMLIDGACGVYDDRPQTCRTYDCRVFAATGIDPNDDAKPDIAERVKHWRFDPVEKGADGEVGADNLSLAAMVAAAQFLRANRAVIGDALVPRTATHIAVGAFMIHETFVGERDGRAAVVVPSMAAVRTALGPV